MTTRNLDMPYRLSADTANVVALNQSVLLVNLRDRIAESPDLTGELTRIDRLMDLFGEAIRTIRGLHDTPAPANSHASRASTKSSASPYAKMTCAGLV